MNRADCSAAGIRSSNGSAHHGRHNNAGYPQQTAAPSYYRGPSKSGTTYDSGRNSAPTITSNNVARADTLVQKAMPTLHLRS